MKNRQKIDVDAVATQLQRRVSAIEGSIRFMVLHQEAEIKDAEKLRKLAVAVVESNTSHRVELLRDFLRDRGPFQKSYTKPKAVLEILDRKRRS